VVVIVVVAGLVWHGRAGAPTATTTKKPAAVSILDVKAKVSSYSPKGNGFRQKNGAWVTEHYNNAKFGGLKSGLGLVLDLGSARKVSSIEFDAGTGPLTVQVRAGDQASDPSAYAPLGDSVSASGSKKLATSGGEKHRYWMIWVSELGPDAGRYSATISAITVHAPA
jgi:hypothetical protein